MQTSLFGYQLMWLHVCVIYCVVWFCDLFFLFYFLVLLAEGGKYDLICYFDIANAKECYVSIGWYIFLCFVRHVLAMNLH